MEILSDLKNKVWSKFGILFIYQIIGFASGFIINILLARNLSVLEFGQYHYVVTIMVLIAHSVNSAILNKNTRDVAENRDNIISTYVNSLILLLVGLLVYVIISSFIYLKEEYNSILMYCLWLIFFLQVFQIINISILRGLKKNILSELPETVLQKLFFLIFILLGILFNFELHIAILLLLLSYIISTSISFYLLRSNIDLKSLTKRYNYKSVTTKDIVHYLPFVVAGGISIINNNVDIIILGIISGETEVAYYKVGVQGSRILIFFLSATNIVVAPMFVEWFQKKDFSKIEEVGTKISKYLTVTLIPVLILYYLFGEMLIKTLFGVSYLKSYFPLLILSFTQFISTAIGSVGIFLNMSNNEKINMYIVAFSVTINIILNFILIPIYGATGAALASMIGILSGGLIASLVIYKKYRIVLSSIFQISKS